MLYFFNKNICTVAFLHDKANTLRVLYNCFRAHKDFAAQNLIMGIRAENAQT